MKTVNTKTKQALVSLCVSAIMLALATVLSLLKIWSFPWGGSITLASMVPIIFISIAYGPVQGLLTAFLYSWIQFFLDLGSIMSWGLTKEMFIWTALLDYILPFTLIGIAGIFAKKGFAGRMTGVCIAVTLRYASHVLSGTLLWHSAGKIWEGLVIENEWLYSIVYNACYMLPELIITAAITAILLKNKSFLRLIPSRV
ncbi:MAG: proton-coupled thiamine transporter YuaJ [Ruminococcaceae bacterium]|nr:proton-coupled thiamine transporter YuaJ [Oscillospiraceae bacterium]MBQ1260102.1 energy-coupled thiamine transporter ThiT [Clostridia bacterium]